MPKYAPTEAYNNLHRIEDVVVPFNNRTKKPKPTLAFTHRRLSKEWHRTRNCGFGPDDFSFGSQISVWWQCKENRRHVWREQIGKRTGRGDGCPYCSHQRVSKPISLATIDPKLAKEWHPDNKLTPEQATSKSRLKVLWQCQKRLTHTWRATIKQRNDGKTNCPKCYVETIYNIRKNPAVFKYFDLQKNKDIDPSRIGTKAVWWRCEEGSDHSWCRPFYKHVKFQCPFCLGRLLSKTNSLKKLYPKIAKEFHPTRNAKLTSATVTARSIRMSWWKCSINPRHVWQSTIYNRTISGNGCPGCWKERRPAAFRVLRAKQREERLERMTVPPRRKLKPLGVKPEDYIKGMKIN